MTPLTLPTKKEDVSDEMSAMANAARQARNPMWVQWYIAHWYLRGMRKFAVKSRVGGDVRGFWDVGATYTGFRYEDVLVKRQRELGRLMRMDVRPRCTRTKLGLQSIRDAAMAQVVYDTQIDNARLEVHKLEFLGGVIDYGTMGQMLSTTGGVADLGLDPEKYTRFKAHLEVVPPWQILPIPASVDCPSMAQGIMRERVVPLSWLESRRKSAGLSLGQDDAELAIVTAAPGSLPSDPDNPDSAAQSGASDASDTTTGGKDKKSSRHVRLREAWLYDDCGRVARYIAQAGERIIRDSRDDFMDMPADKRPVCGLSVARYIPLGQWWGRSFVDVLIPIANEAEQMWHRLFQNVKDMDDLGLLVIPSTSQVTREHLNKKDRPRAVFAEPDYAAGNNKIYNIAPANTGDTPGRIAASANSLMDRISRESEMFSGNAPGRVEGLPGLGFLYETSLISLIPTSVSVADSYLTSWRALLYGAGQRIGPQDALRLGAVDDAIAGVILADDGTVQISDNPIPDPDAVDTVIRETQPRNMMQRKAELGQMLAQGVIPLEDFLWISLKEGLDIPAGNDEIINAMRTTMLRLVLLFNDGVTPRRDRVAPTAYSNHKAAIRVIRAFLNRPDVQFASGAVKDAVLEMLEYHEGQQFGTLPEPMPHPEDAAGMEQALSDAQAMQAGAPPGPPPFTAMPQTPQ